MAIRYQAPRLLIGILLLLAAFGCNPVFAAEDVDAAQLQRAAEAGDAAAQYAFALRLGAGEGVARDQEAARRWLLHAAENGHAAAQSTLGASLIDSDDESARAEALVWLQKAAAQGDMQANMQLGVRAADSGQRDEALGYFERAAEAGDAEVQHALATMYERGELAPADSRRALHWVRRAAAGGNRYAQYRLGTRYAEGEGVERDAAAAYLWMWRALSGDPEDSERARVAAWLSPEWRASLEAIARDWKPGDPMPSAPLDVGPPSPTSGHMLVTVFDYSKVGEEGGLPPSREQHWRIIDAVAVHNQGGRSSVLLSTSLIDPAAVDEVADSTFGIAALGGLALYIDADGNLDSGTFKHEGGYVELLASAVQADIEVDARGVRGRVSLPRDSEQFEQTRYSIEVQFDAAFHGGVP